MLRFHMLSTLQDWFLTFQLVTSLELTSKLRVHHTLTESGSTFTGSFPPLSIAAMPPSVEVIS